MPLNEGAAMLTSAAAMLYAVWLTVGTHSPMRDWCNAKPMRAVAVILGTGALAYYFGGLAHPGDGWHFYPP